MCWYWGVTKGQICSYRYFFTPLSDLLVWLPMGFVPFLHWPEWFLFSKYLLSFPLSSNNLLQNCARSWCRKPEMLIPYSEWKSLVSILEKKNPSHGTASQSCGTSFTLDLCTTSAICDRGCVSHWWYMYVTPWLSQYGHLLDILCDQHA